MGIPDSLWSPIPICTIYILLTTEGKEDYLWVSIPANLHHGDSSIGADAGHPDVPGVAHGVRGHHPGGLQLMSLAVQTEGVGLQSHVRSLIIQHVTSFRDYTALHNTSQQKD